MNKRLVLAIGGVLVLIAVAMVLWPRFRPNKVEPLRTVALLSSLANDATNSINDKKARVRAPLFGAEEIGTLIDPNGSIAVSRGCRSAVEPVTQHPAGFPPGTYKITEGAAADFTQGFIGGLAAHMNLGADDAINLAFDDVDAKILYDDDLTAMAQTPECQKAINGRKLWIVRGYIEAKRTFTITGGMIDKASVENAASSTHFDVNANSRSSSVTVADKQAIPLFEIVSAFDPQSAQQLAAPAANNAALIGVAVVGGKQQLAAVAPVTRATGRVFFQRDVADHSGVAAILQESVRALNLPVEPKVEQIPSNRVPSRASVRYFNGADEAEAQRVFAVVKARFPDATLDRMRLSAPAGQMEVWIPRATKSL
jgi:hypothetical protein